MSDPKQPVRPHDYTTGDVEVYRRGRNQQRRRYRRRERRSKWMDIIAEELPARHAELLELRKTHPMGFRKALVKTAEQLGMYEYINRCTPRDLPPLEERRRLDEEERKKAEDAAADRARAYTAARLTPKERALAELAATAALASATPAVTPKPETKPKTAAATAPVAEDAKPEAAAATEAPVKATKATTTEKKKKK